MVLPFNRRRCHRTIRVHLRSTELLITELHMPFHHRPRTSVLKARPAKGVVAEFVNAFALHLRTYGAIKALRAVVAPQFTAMHSRHIAVFHCFVTKFAGEHAMLHALPHVHSFLL